MCRLVVLVSLTALVCSSSASALSARGAAAANGHWECHCICMDDQGGVQVWDVAKIPGKCESNTEGGDCEFTDDVGGQHSGTLEGCGNVFVIDSSRDPVAN